MKYLKIGKYLQKKRLKAGMSQVEVGKLLGYSSPQFISNSERGLCLIPLRKMKLVTHLYGIPPAEFAEMLSKFRRDEIFRAMGVRK